ncbi:hypothetical protein NBRC116591_29480 [Sessilibacter corallicola]|uniref:Uncharacterized protein n=1 Tax=Sessilibacter corallicola TaxID=2904075 RepID=A0ABQ0ABV1_9GAMM
MYTKTTEYGKRKIDWYQELISNNKTIKNNRCNKPIMTHSKHSTIGPENFTRKVKNRTKEITMVTPKYSPTESGKTNDLLSGNENGYRVYKTSYRIHSYGMF